jgi:hypothetical protein
VANEGRAGRDIANKFMDPPGTVTMIEREKYGNPSEHMVDFSKGEGR